MIEKSWSGICLASALLLALVFAFPGTAAAAPPDPAYAGPEKCAECHPVEATHWESSPHAQALVDAESSFQLACSEEGGFLNCDCLECHTTAFDADQGTYAHAGVTCEACHGAYVAGHPESATVTLVSDSQLCVSCHEPTHAEWLSSAHADANIECLACHQAHSQGLRLDKETLCTSCHPAQLDDAIHSAHNSDETACVDCHLGVKPAEQTTFEVIQVADRPAALSHSLEVGTSDSCVQCHADNVAVHQVSSTTDLTAQFGRVATELDDARATIRSLKTLAVVALGAGLGMGGLGGIIGLLLFGCVYQRGSKR